MGNQKQKWTPEEEEALHQGVQKHGTGKWKNILRDKEFAEKLCSRSNIDLKDKWRNLSVFPGQNSKDKSRTPKSKSLVIASASPATPASPAPLNVIMQNVTPVPQIQTPTSQPSQIEDAPPQYNSMIFEALSTIKDANGSDLSAIVSFIEQKHNLPQNQNFRRTLGSKLRRLVTQGKLEKVQNSYKIKDTSAETKPDVDSKPPAPKEMNSPAPAASNTSAFDNAMREASEIVAFRIADAENKSFLAAEAVKETERYAKFVEENDAMLKFAEELLEKCKLGGSFRFA
ncbi:telomere repeat-binding factor 4-like [Vicia villosa]|uniref:telomere repeat-binding factor 4-like n=1 Tax=Vicia villosa TaxID=3911 RepID=UPI00273C0EC5|nr:telomere repeat-binding factor 4-like [Vicia villosa]